MIEIGRLCVKISGRDSGRKCVVVETVDDSKVLIDGNTRRRKCSIKHLEPLENTIKLKKGASHSEVAGEFKKLGFDVWETKPKKSAEKPSKVRGSKKQKPAESEEKKKPEKTEKKADQKKKGQGGAGNESPEGNKAAPKENQDSVDTQKNK